MTIFWSCCPCGTRPAYKCQAAECGLQDEWQLPGAALLSKAEQMSEVPGELTPAGVCKAHQLFAGATLLLRCLLRHLLCCALLNVRNYYAVPRSVKML